MKAAKSCASPRRAAGGETACCHQPLPSLYQGNARLPRAGAQRLQAGVAQAAPWQINDALERQIIVWLGDYAQIGDDIADFGALIKTQTAHHPVGDGQAQQLFLKRPGLHANPHQNGHLAQRRLAA